MIIMKYANILIVNILFCTFRTSTFLYGNLTDLTCIVLFCRDMLILVHHTAELLGRPRITKRSNGNNNVLHYMKLTVFLSDTEVSAQNRGNQPSSLTQTN